MAQFDPEETFRGIGNRSQDYEHEPKLDIHPYQRPTSFWAGSLPARMA